MDWQTLLPLLQSNVRLPGGAASEEAMNMLKGGGSIGNYASGAARSALNGITFGHEPQMAGLIAKMMGQDSQKAQDYESQQAQKFTSANPNTAGASGVLGQLPVDAIGGEGGLGLLGSAGGAALKALKHPAAIIPEIMAGQATASSLMKHMPSTGTLAGGIPALAAAAPDVIAKLAGVKEPKLRPGDTSAGQVPVQPKKQAAEDTNLLSDEDKAFIDGTPAPSSGSDLLSAEDKAFIEGSN